MSVRTKVFFDTPDHVHIVGDYVLPEDDIQNCAVLVHMMPATRASFSFFQEALALGGVASLAIDLRGHGDSVYVNKKEKALDYRDFSPKQHQQSIWDVRGAVVYLCQLAAKEPSACALVGASIGANLAIQCASEEHSIPLVIALSPGIDYRGICTLPLIQKMDSSRQHIILASSSEDAYSLESVQKLHQAAPKYSELVTREGSEHGTDMLEDYNFALKIAQALCTIKA
jgi:alpha-beta hydrolase superfamily lysophospholipase